MRSEIKDLHSQSRTISDCRKVASNLELKEIVSNDMDINSSGANDASTAAATLLNSSSGGGSGLLRPEDGISFVIFGASGDLTKRKLIPALYNLACSDLLPRDFSVIGYSVTPMNDDSFREAMRTAVQESKEANAFDAKIWDEFARGLSYITD